MHRTELVADRLALPDSVVVQGLVKCAGGRIAEIRTATREPSLRGVLLPGFVDLQVNGAGGRGVEELSDDALECAARTVFAGGAVAFLPTLITAPWKDILRQIEAVADWCARFDPGTDAAAPLGIHVEGPFLTSPGVHDAACFVDPTPERIEQMIRAGRGKLRMVTLSSSRKGAPEAVAQLLANGVTPSIGHVAEVDGFDACVRAGARLVTHLFNAMGAMHHREHGVAGLALDHESVSCPLILDGAHLHPVTVRNAYRILGPERTVLVTDSVSAAGMPDGDYVLGGERIRLRGNFVRDEHGVIAGSALTMGKAARSFLDFVPWADAWALAKVASSNPCRAIGEEDRGAIAVGKLAEFTLLGEDGTCRALRVR
ncbi:MAG: N-acetylglucosamine-6-phosphate deacetylase [Planctomycetota bacterium]